MPLNADIFDGIPEFIAVSECRGFSAAAKRLGVSNSHVSRKINALESRLGTVLLARTTRTVKLTETGERYVQKCREVLDGMIEANEVVQTGQVRLEGVLRVSAAGEFAEEYVVPALLAFAEQHPALRIDINFNSRMVNFIEEGIDFAIRYGRLQDSGLIARKLATRHLVALASKSYLQQHGVPTHPRELIQHSCLVANNNRWLFSDRGQPLEIRVHGRWQTNSARALIKACKQGLGICYLPKSSYGDALQNPQMTEILTPFSSHDLTTWIIYSNRKYQPVRVRLAIDHLLKTFTNWHE
ncbi:MAG: LysR family transcriptional regulator [Pseudomonadales bacterium]|nr:LysR family transcriptional regulator [Pseudomonadales bacterium]